MPREGARSAGEDRKARVAAVALHRVPGFPGLMLAERELRIARLCLTRPSSLTHRRPVLVRCGRPNRPAVDNSRTVLVACTTPLPIQIAKRDSPE